MIWVHVMLGYQLDLVLACLEAWETAPARPVLEPEARRAGVAA